MLSPLLALPILARSTTVTEWSTIAIGQGIGAVAALAVSYGWSVVGPARAALCPDDQLASLWVLSTRTRIAALMATVVPLVLACVASLPEGSRALGTAVALATSLTGFSLMWFAVGTGRSKQLVAYDSVPRAVGSVAGAALAAATGDLLYFPLMLAASIALPMGAFTWLQMRSTPARASGSPTVRHGTMVQAMATEIIAGSYTVGASALVGQAASAGTVATFNSGERLTRAGSVAISVTGNTLMGWVARAKGRMFVKRCGLAASAHFLVGLIGFTVLVVLGPELTGLLFGDFRMADEDCRWFGLYFFLWSMETVTGRHVLANKHHTRALLLSTSVGGAFGLISIPWAASTMGSTGAAIAMCSAMTVIVLLQIPAVAAVLSREWGGDDRRHL